MNTTSVTTPNRDQLPLVGILGDGQLAMMMADAYKSMGGQVYVLGTSFDGPASVSADKVFIGELDDEKALAELFQVVDVVTLENEFIDAGLLTRLASQFSTPLYPEPERFSLIEDKLSEKQFYQSQGADLAEFLEIKNADDIPDVVGYLKLAKGGYDGHGTYRVANKAEAVELFDKIKSVGTVLFEYAIDYQKELSLVAATNGKDTVFYPMVETLQENGTCRYVKYPADISTDIEQLAQSQVAAILKELNTKGLFAFEYFLTKDDQLLINESAPRPHNSGHITLDLVDCSQFENHMRAVASLPLITPKIVQESMVMANLLGTQNGKFDANTVYDEINDPKTSIMLYRKKESRVNRKMGHINLWGDDAMNRAKQLVKTLEI